MDNRFIITELKAYVHLLSLTNTNPFRISSYEKSIRILSELDFNISEENLAKISSIDGIGSTILQSLKSILYSGYLPEKMELAKKIPISILSLFKISGLGAKKIKLIYNELGSVSLEDLKKACEENKLQTLKGFTAKSEQVILQKVDFLLSSKGKCLLKNGIEVADEVEKMLYNYFSSKSIIISTVGDVKQRKPIISNIELLIGTQDIERVEKELLDMGCVNKNNCLTITIGGFEVYLFLVHEDEFVWESIIKSSSLEWKKNLTKPTQSLKSESEYFELIQKPIIDAVRREERFIGVWENDNFKEDDYIKLKDLKGCVHNHSTWSDGKNSIEEMATYCQDKLGLEYYGNCDHSKAAFYANGLTEERLIEQHKEIDALNQNLNIHVLKGIEVDILADGQLDYSDEVLKSFDLVVASVHSGLDMQREKATQRVIKAIENPYTHILGHLTGRLLLQRQGYELDMDKVIDACASNHVSIELNANPRRLDIDYSFLTKVMDKGIMVSINPDAHHYSQLHYMEYGVWMAQKGGLLKEHCLNALPKKQFLEWLEKKSSFHTEKY